MKRAAERVALVLVGVAVGWLVFGRSEPSAGEAAPHGAPADVRAQRAAVRGPDVEDDAKVSAVPVPVVAPRVAPAPPAGVHAAPGVMPAAATPSARNGMKQVLETVNACDDAMTVSWLDYEGKEQGPSIILPGASLNTSTWEGHAFRIRVGNRERAFVRDVVAPQGSAARLVLCGPSDAFEVLDAGMDRLSAPQCTVPFEPEPATAPPSVTLSGRYPVVFRNSCAATRVRVDWIQFDGGLRPTAEVAPRAQFDQNTFVGHTWRVRDANTGRWIRDFALDGGAVVDLCACD